MPEKCCRNCKFWAQLSYEEVGLAQLGMCKWEFPKEFPEWVFVQGNCHTFDTEGIGCKVFQPKEN